MQVPTTERLQEVIVLLEALTRDFHDWGAERTAGKIDAARDILVSVLADLKELPSNAGRS